MRGKNSAGEVRNHQFWRQQQRPYQYQCNKKKRAKFTIDLRLAKMAMLASLDIAANFPDKSQMQFRIKFVLDTCSTRHQFNSLRSLPSRRYQFTKGILCPNPQFANVSQQIIKSHIDAWQHVQKVLREIRDLQTSFLRLSHYTKNLPPHTAFSVQKVDASHRFSTTDTEKLNRIELECKGKRVSSCQ